MSEGFYISLGDQPHPGRTREILAAHPEIRHLVGRNRLTALLGLAIAASQITIAAVMGRLGLTYWWAAIFVAYCIGAFANHCLYVVIHDSAHRLIFRSRAANYVLAIFVDLPNLVPAAIGFSICHLKHHAHQGDYRDDGDIPAEWEARLIGNRWYAKAAWLLLFPVFQLTRPMRMNQVSIINAWTLSSLAAAVAFDSLIIVMLGWNAILYLAASFFFSVGLHPLGARWIQEHYTLNPDQETRSYYGALNAVALNVGYHNEHHDFPSVPWNRLPRIRMLAPEFYDSLDSTRSWLRLLTAFLFDRRYSLYSRVLRPQVE